MKGKMIMKKTTLKKCETKLNQMKQDILDTFKEKAKESLSIDTNVQDEGDIAQEASQHSVDLVLLSKNKQKLKLIEQALLRIKEGTYGICIDTEEEIEESRLIANPLAMRSIFAQETFEREQKNRQLAKKPTISQSFSNDD